MMGPTNVIVNGSGLHDAASGKLIKDSFASRGGLENYVKHHCLVLPAIDDVGKPWLLDGKSV